MAKSKLKRMAETGNPWAIETLARMQAQGRAAGLHGAAMQRGKRLPAERAAYREAQRLGERMARDRDPPEVEAARDIREWTDGPKPAPWRVYRLAQALKNA
jgi:hypothetical protein